MAIQNRNTTLPGIWASTAQTTIPTPPVAGVTYRDTTLNSTAIDKAWSFKTIVDSSDFNQHAFLQDTLIKESEQYGVMRWNNTTTYKEGGFCLGQDGKLYQAKRDNQGKEPTANADDWKVFTSGGGFPIGSIGYTLRTEVPEGGAWCDGAEYTQAMFPDIYQMLVDGKIQSTTYQNFTSSVSTNGSCGFFALDSSAQKFKVPLLTNVYLKAGQAPSMFGAESLPNFDAYIFAGDNGTGLNEDIGITPSMTKNSASGAAEVVTNTKNRGYSAVGLNATETKGFRISPSLSSSTYQDGAKVNPDHVVYRAYVVLYASAAEASVAQAAEFMTALDGKANVALDNVSPAQSFKDMSIDWFMPDYTAGISKTPNVEFIAEFAGWIYAYTDARSSGNAIVDVYINDELIIETNYRALAHVLAPFAKGDRVKAEVYYTNEVIVYPCKGVN